MQKKIANTVRMLKTTGNVLEQNKTKWDMIKILSTTVPSYMELIKKVDDAMLESERDTKASSMDKRIFRKELEEHCFYIASALHSIGSFEKNSGITAVTALKESTLKNYMEDMLVTKAKTLHTLAKENTEKLANYGIVEADITKLDELIKKFASIQTIPRSMVVDRKAAKLSLEDAVGQAKDMLTDQIDLQMEMLRKREPDFYNAFLAARKVVDTGIRHKKKEDAKPDTKPTTDTKPKSDATK